MLSGLVGCSAGTGVLDFSRVCLNPPYAFSDSWFWRSAYATYGSPLAEHSGCDSQLVRFFGEGLCPSDSVKHAVNHWDHSRLLRRGRRLELATLAWNVVGVVVLAIGAISARSVALAGFGLDSLIEIGASAVVLWELGDVAQDRQRRAIRIIGIAFIALAAYLAVQSTAVLVLGFHAHHSLLGIAWTSITALVTASASPAFCCSERPG